MDSISGRARPPYVTFPRFLGLFLQHLGDGYAGELEDEMRCPTMSSRLFSAAPQEGDPHLTNQMLDWIAHPYTADPHPVNFVPIIVEPIAQQPGEAQPAGEAQPTDDPTTADSSSSSSSYDRQSPLHQSPAEIPSGNTESIHLNSDADTNYSGPSSESPIITRPPPQQIPTKPLLPGLHHLRGSLTTPFPPTCHLSLNQSHLRECRLIFNPRFYNC